MPVSISSEKIYLPQIISFKTRASYAAEIVRAWQHSVDSIITVGRLIAEAKAELRHGEFSAMIRADLPFGPRTARPLMAVAQHPVIAKGTHASVLPPSWTTLYELTRLPEKTLEAKIAEGVIHAGIERKDVAALRCSSTRRRRARGSIRRILSIIARPLPQPRPWSTGC